MRIVIYEAMRHSHMHHDRIINLCIIGLYSEVCMQLISAVLVMFGPGSL